MAIGLNPIVGHGPAGQLVGGLVGLTLFDTLPAQTGEVRESDPRFLVIEHMFDSRTSL